MALYLIRCAKAERRDRWEGDDKLRPLSAVGRAQAIGLADWLAQVPVSHVLSSPFMRCMETVIPLAETHDLEVEEIKGLLPRKPEQRVLDLIRVLPDDSVLCSHGRVITRVMEVLTLQGAELEGPSDFRRGATWVLERVDGRVVRAHTVAPRGDLDVVR